MSQQIRQVLTILSLNRDDDPGAVNPSPMNQWVDGDCKRILNFRTYPSDLGDGGKAKNLKGNVLVEFDMPGGQNKTIGRGEDKENDSLIFFVYNSLGNHSILRYWHSRGPIGEIELLMQGDFLGFTTDGTIHSVDTVGDLLYWCDDGSNEPRKINMRQAAGAGKYEIHELYFGEIPDDTTSRQISVTLIRNGIPVATIPVLLTATGADLSYIENFIIAFTNAANATVGLSTFFVFASKGKKVVASAKGNGEYEFILNGIDTLTSGGSIAVPTWDQPVSRYLAIDDPYIINRICPPHDQRPTSTYISDPKRTSNFVDKSVFQFAIRILRSDYEETVFSSFSNLSTPEGSCISGGTINNCIEVSFGTPRLINKNWLTVIRAVQVMVRECLDASTADFGEWKVAATLFREDFVLNPTYRFYNDKHYSPVSVDDSTRLYDTVPLRAPTEVMIQSTDTVRGVIANCTEDFDSPEVPINLSLTISDENPIVGQYGIVRGRIYIHAPMSGDNILGYTGGKWSRYYGAIHDRGDGEGVVWGGIGSAMGLLWFGDASEPGVGSDYGQKFGSEPGFCVYSAHTPFYTFSRQKEITSVDTPGGVMSVTQLTDNVFDTSRFGYSVNSENSTYRQMVRWVMRDGARVDGGVWSEFELRLPVGTHILRVASSLVGKSDTYGSKYNATNPDLYWQRTSCPLSKMGGLEGATEITVTVTAGSTNEIGDTFVVDMTNPNASLGLTNPFQTRAIRFYNYDHDAENDSDGQLREGTQLELQNFMLFQQALIGSSIDPVVVTNPVYAGERQDGSSSPIWQQMIGGFCRTDHNGFGWAMALYSSTGLDRPRLLYAGMYGVTANPAIPAASIDFGACTTTLIAYNSPADGTTFYNFGASYYSGGFDILNSALVSGSGFLDIEFAPIAKDYIFYNQNRDAMERCSTTVRGRLTTPSPDSIGIPDVLVSIENSSRARRTDSDGNFSILVMADAYENLNNRGALRTARIEQGTWDRIIFNSDLLCRVTFISGDIYAIQLEGTSYPTTPVGIPRFETAAEWSQTVPFLIDDIIAFISSSTIRSIFGRGSTPQIGMILMDGGGRVTTVGTSDANVVSIPFATENLKIFDPVTYPVDTYHLGPATINWALPANVPVPDVGRFTKYRFCTTLDGSRNRIFEWAANDIRYVQRYDEANSETIDTTYAIGDAEEIYFGISNIAYYKEEHTDSLVAYTPQRGDRLVLIASSDGTPLVSATKIYESVITGQRTTTSATGVVETWLTVENQSDWPELEPGTFFLAYTPAKTTNTKVFYEFGPWYDIIDPYGDTPSWSLSSGSFTEGFDYYRKRRIPVRPETGSPTYVEAFVEDTSMSDFYDSNVWGRGRPNLFDPNIRQVKYSGRMRWSGSYSPGTKTNGLSSFSPLDFEDLLTEYGPITRTVMVGEVLLVACLLRLVSRYPGKQSFEQALPDGSLSANSSRVLGSSHVDAGNYGCSHGESMVVNKTHCYGYDIVNGVIWRKAVNETFPISSYKMQRDIAEKSRYYRQLPMGSYQIWAMFDKYFEEYIICFPEVVDLISPPFRDDGTGLPVDYEGETLSFHEGGNRWMTAYSYQPECAAMIGVEIATFVAGKLWLHNRNPIHNSFYGVVYNSDAEMAFNLYPAKRKRLLNIEVKSSIAPDVPEILTDTNQTSEMVRTDFMAQEGDWYCEFFKDSSTPGVASPLVNGDELVCNSVNLLVRFDGGDRKLLTSLTVATVPSERSQK